MNKTNKKKKEAKNKESKKKEKTEEEEKEEEERILEELKKIEKKDENCNQRFQTPTENQLNEYLFFFFNACFFFTFFL